MKPLVFTDLDDTLFQTRRKIPVAEAEGLTRAATAVDGNPDKSSWMTRRQAALLAWLTASTEVIPVTARSAASFGKLEIGLSGWAVISNGAVILEPGGQVHGPWAARVAAVLVPHREALGVLLEAGRVDAARHGLDMRSWIVEDGGLASYVVFKLNDPDTDGADLQRLCFDGHDLTGWVRHRNGNNLALIPPDSGKRPAVAYLRRHLDPDGTRLSLAAGDSLSDLDFMALADLQLVPAASQIARSRLAP